MGGNKGHEHSAKNFQNLTQKSLSVESPVVIKDLSDSPDPFSPGVVDGRRDQNHISFSVKIEGTDDKGAVDKQEKKFYFLTRVEILGSDSNPITYPYAPEICDYENNDCDNEIDEGAKRNFYRDADRDGWGNPYDYVLDCYAPQGHVSYDNPASRLCKREPFCVDSDWNSQTKKCEKLPSC